MTDSAPPHRDDEGTQPILTLIAQIRDKRVQAGLLSAEDRRRCVEVLRGEGYGIAEIAQILEKNERTIRRDLEQLRAEHALSPDPRLAERFIGQLVHEAETSMSRLRRIAREQGASAMERLMAESSAWKVFRELFQSLQSVGYLPRMPTNVVAEVFQRFDAEPLATYEELDRQVREIVEVSRESGQYTEEQAKRCLALMDDVNRGRLSARLERIVKEEGVSPQESNRAQEEQDQGRN